MRCTTAGVLVVAMTSLKKFLEGSEKVLRSFQQCSRRFKQLRVM